MTGLAAEDTPIRDTADVEVFARHCFNGTTGDQVGTELEFLVFDRADFAAEVPLSRVADALPPLPGGSRVTFEPGGQLELSGPAGSLPEAVGRLATDVELAREALWEAGLVLGGVGLDPVRPARWQLRLPRYQAMAKFFDPPYGLLMMCSTASIQVNLDLGGDPSVRWERAHLLGPVLMAAFANSPIRDGLPCGWVSGRQAVWENLDRSRTAPVPPGGDPAAAWAKYVLDARLMLVRESTDHYRPVLDGSTFRDWLASPERPPTVADLAYHATTVFPPVRPRGWLEIRYLDAQHPANWPVCVAVTHALIMDDRAADAALAAAEPCAAMWPQAARRGLAEPRLKSAADDCFRAALAALPRLGASAGLIGEVAKFADRHVTTGRSPAVDLLDRLRAPESSLPAWLAGGEPV